MDKYQIALALFHTKFRLNSEPITKDRLLFRQDLIEEEVAELRSAIINENAEEIVDALGDIIYIAFGTADYLGIDLPKAFEEIQRANLRKERGTKPGREHSGGFDVRKPAGWKAPDHTGNHGNIKKVFNNTNKENNTNE